MKTIKLQAESAYGSSGVLFLPLDPWVAEGRDDYFEPDDHFEVDAHAALIDALSFGEYRELGGQAREAGADGVCILCEEVPAPGEASRLIEDVVAQLAAALSRSVYSVSFKASHGDHKRVRAGLLNDNQLARVIEFVNAYSLGAGLEEPTDVPTPPIWGWQERELQQLVGRLIAIGEKRLRDLFRLCYGHAVGRLPALSHGGWEAVLKQGLERAKNEDDLTEALRRATTDQRQAAYVKAVGDKPSHLAALWVATARRDRELAKKRIEESEIRDYQSLIFGDATPTKRRFIKWLAIEGKLIDNGDIPFVARAIQHFAKKYQLNLTVTDATGKPTSVNVTSKWRNNRSHYVCVLRTADALRIEVSQTLDLPAMTAEP